jgi:hypothetical protein
MDFFLVPLINQRRELKHPISVITIKLSGDKKYMKGTVQVSIRSSWREGG